MTWIISPSIDFDKSAGDYQGEYASYWIYNKNANFAVLIYNLSVNLLKITYNGGFIDGKYKSRIEIDRGFLIRCFDRKCIIRIDDGNEEEETRFKKMKCSIPQVIALLGEMELRVDDNGIAYYELNTILKKGLNGYGGF